MRIGILLGCLIAIGCQQSAKHVPVGNRDLGVPNAGDVDASVPDFGASDASVLGGGYSDGMVDGGDDAGGEPDLAGTGPCTPVGGTKLQWLWDSISVPSKATDFAIDINGDGRVDNQFGNIVATLMSLNLNPQFQTTESVNGGLTVTLLDLRTSDASGQNDTCAGSSVYIGKPAGMAPAMGSSRVVDPSYVPGSFSGTLASGTFNAQPLPAVTRAPTSFVLPLPIFLSTTPTPLPITGAHVRYKVISNSVTQGQLNAAVRKADVDGKIVPALAAGMNNKIQTDKSMLGGLTQTDVQLLMIFDTGGCVDATGTPAVAGDGIISPCELATNKVMKSALAPDVQMFDSSGSYAPNPANSNPDSLSIGLGFTAVQASF
jgi:hypothetical protein